VQFAESREHRHVHIHVIPRDPELPGEYWGPGVFALLGVAEEDRVPAAAMNDFDLELREALGHA
jgi:diadenosine tetraphosphate (Ap4A) HIT family hydrolase